MTGKANITGNLDVTGDSTLGGLTFSNSPNPYSIVNDGTYLKFNNNNTISIDNNANMVLGGVEPSTGTGNLFVTGNATFKGNATINSLKLANNNWMKSSDNANRLYYNENSVTQFGSGNGEYYWRNNTADTMNASNTSMSLQNNGTLTIGNNLILSGNQSNTININALDGSGITKIFSDTAASGIRIQSESKNIFSVDSQGNISFPGTLTIKNSIPSGTSFGNGGTQYDAYNPFYYMAIGPITIQAGYFGGSNPSTGSSNVTIYFSTVFSGIPQVIVGLSTGTSSNANTGAGQRSPSSDSVTTRNFRLTSDGNCKVSWIAIGPT